MTLRTRRILYSFFIAIFVIAAPTLVLYTAGFRYDFEYNRIVETGSLVVKSYPQNASIYINGELLEQKSPTIINTILPGKINLLVEKDGYHSWEKTIEIFNRVSTFEETIKLYPKADPKSIIDENVEKYWWNNEQNKLAYTTNENQLRLFNILSQKDTLIANLGKNDLVQFSWSPHDDQFIFGRGAVQTEYFIANAHGLEKVISLNSIFKSNLESLQWDVSDKNTIYAISDGSLYRIPYLLKTKRLVSDAQIEFYLVEEDRILLAEKTNLDEILISWINPSDSSTIHLVPEIIATEKDEFIKTNSHRIAVLNKITKTLTVNDPSIKENAIEDDIIEIQNIKSSLWSQDGQTLVYTDGFGIYRRSFISPITIIPTKNINHLIVKYTQPIKNITWADDESHLLFTTNNTLRVAEINSSSDPRSSVLLENAPTNIITANNVNLITFVNKGKLQAIPISIEDNRRSFLFGNE
jgi:dipeptidyl aminopeptidase/acylaminoacyl peptidase